MRVFFILGLMVYCSPVFTQPVRNILDTQTGLPVSFVTIKVLHAPRGIIASEKGEFKLVIENSDSVLFSCVGYQQKIITGEKIGTTIYLDPHVKKLADVTTSEKKIVRTIYLGNKIEKFKNSENWGPSSNKVKEEFAQKIELPDSSSLYKLNKIFIPVINFRCWGPLLVHIYAADPVSQYPGEELFIKLVTVEKENIHQKKIRIDLTEENLYLRNCKHFFVSIGWPEEAYQNKCMTTIIMSRASLERTYSRQLAGNDFNWFPFGYFKDKFGNSYQARTVYSVLLDELR